MSRRSGAKKSRKSAAHTDPVHWLSVIPNTWGVGLPVRVDEDLELTGNFTVSRTSAWYLSEGKTAYCCWDCWYARYMALHEAFLGPDW